MELLRSGNTRARINSRAAGNSAAVDYAYPVLVDPKSGKRMIPTDELLVGLAEDVQIEDVAGELATAGLMVVEAKGTPRMKAYLLRLINAKTSDPLAVAQTLAASPKVRWATPNFMRELEPHLTPNDPLLAMQQALNNTGQNGALADADVDAAEAWDKHTGTNSIVIAIIDDGVDTTHPDLDIAVNPGESGNGKESNGIDDDGDGFIDNYRGWDFADNDNNPNPVGFNGHGTGCAGVAAAKGNNSLGVAGVAQGCKVLAVKVAEDSGDFTSDEAIGAAISYAARFADVLSNSYGGGAPSPFIDAAIDDATHNGRNGKGCPVFFASGNSASTWYEGGGRWRLPTAGLSGSVRFGFFYFRGETPGGEEAVRVDNVCLLDANGYTHKNAIFPRQDFEGTFPPLNWETFRSLGAGGDWSQSSTNALLGTGGQFSATSPPLQNGEYAWLFTSPIIITGAESFTFASSSDMPEDSLFYVDVYDSSFTVYYGSYGPLNSGQAFVSTETAYPASSPNAIAVGAATDMDRRSDYSQYGGKLDFVAPSNGGWNDIATLDPVGSVGWTDTDYKMNFGGTSSACPLAAGVAALVLSLDPTLTRDQLLALMRVTSDKIGDVSYTNGKHPFYGYGRINAASALSALGIPTVTVAPTGGVTNSNPIRFSLTFSEPVTGLTMDGVTVTNGTKSQLTGGGDTYILSVIPNGQGAVICQVNTSAAVNILTHPNAASNAASVTFDSIPPVVGSASIASNNGNTSRAKTGNVVTLIFGVNEAVKTPSVTIASHAATVTNVTPNLWKASYTMTAADVEGSISYSIAITDHAGNAGASVTTTTDNTAVVFDRTAPTITFGNPSPSIARSGTVSYLVSFADASPTTATLTENQITLLKTGTANGILGVTGSGSSRTVLISNISGNGTVAIALAPGVATDSAGNSSLAAGPSTTSIVDNTAPTIAISDPSAAITARGSVTYLVTYGDANFNSSSLSGADITLNRSGTANGSVTVTGSGVTRAVTISSISGEGTLAISLAAGTAIDRAGNTSPATGTSAAFMVDNTAPVIMIGAPSRTLVQSGSISYPLTYTDNHFNASTLVVGNITLNRTGSATGIIAVGGVGANRTVTVSSIEGNGTLSISIAAGTASDLAGNISGAVGPSTAITVDNAPPTLSSVSLSSDNPRRNLAKAGNSLTLRFVSSEPIKTPTVTLAGHAAVVQQTDSNNWVASALVTNTTPQGPAGIQVAFADLAENQGTPVTASSDASSVTVDLTAPEITSAHITSTNGNPRFAKIGDTLMLTFVANEAIQAPSVNIAGLPATILNVSENRWTASLTLSSDVDQGVATIFIHFSDLAGNIGTSVTGTSDDSEVVVDNRLPEILAISAAQAVNPGGVATMTVTADSLSPISYRWFKDTELIEGAISATLTFTAAQEEDEGTYLVVLTNVAGDVSSEAISLDVNDPVRIIEQPTVQMASQNENALFSVSATGTGELSYQWRKNGTAIDGATTSNYAITNAQPDDQGFYDVLITNIVGAVESDEVELVLFTGRPQIVAQPASHTIVAGTGVTFSVAVKGTAPFTYQWLKAGTSIPNATTAAYTIPTTKDADAGIYGVIVFNSAGYTISDGATLAFSQASRYSFSTFAGTAGMQGATNAIGVAARFSLPEMIVADTAGNFFVTDSGNHTVRKVTSAGEVSVFAGQPSVAGTSDGQGNDARFSTPTGLTIDADDNLYVTDTGSHLIRKITAEGAVSTLAGKANTGGSNDGNGTAASFLNPRGVAVDATGTLYVTDSGNHALRKITPEGEVTTLAGLAGIWGSADGASSTARFNKPMGVAVDSLGNIYVADQGNHAIRMVTPSGIVSTPAGLKGTGGNRDAIGTAARFKSPSGIAVDGNGNLFVCDTGNHKLRMITPAGTVTTLGGSTTAGSTDGLGSGARFHAPRGLTVTGNAELYVVDTDNHTIRLGTPVALPQIAEQPKSMLVAQGEPATFVVTASGTMPLNYQWRKNGVPISGATGTSYRIAASTPANAGNYSVTVKNALGAVTTTAARLGVVSLAERTVVAKETATVTFVAPAAGEGLGYLWHKNGAELAASKVGTHSITGVNTNKLVIKSVLSDDNADYTCVVRLGTSRLESGSLTLRVYTNAPAMTLDTETVLAPAIVSGAYAFVIPVDPRIELTPTTYTATGLPRGMKIDAATGIITGRPTTASPLGKPYRITITASNGFGKSSTVVLLTVSALPANAIGTFSGLVGNDTLMNGGYGGRFSMVSSPTGSFSGSLVLAGRTSRFTGVFDTAADGTPSVTVTLPQTTLSAELHLQFSIDIADGRLHGSLSNALSPTLAEIDAWRSAGGSTLSSGQYTAALISSPAVLGMEQPVGSYPEGEGYTTLQLSRTGTVTWSGRLSDGIAITGATTTGPDGQIPLHLMLYANTGSLQGWSRVDANSRDMDGLLHWIKTPQPETSKTRNYKKGFPRHALTLTGGKYTKPGTGHIILDLAPTPLNAVVSFADGALPAPIVQALTVTKTHAVQLPRNEQQLKISTLNPTTGHFGGTFVLVDLDPVDTSPPIALLNRKASFNGAFVERLGRGVGYFLLQHLPQTAAQNINNTTISSGRISLNPVSVSP